MAITTNIQLVKENLIRLGLDYDAAAEIIDNHSDGFAVSYNHLDEDTAYAACIKLRTVLYSWLRLLGVKHMYSIGIRNNVVTVGKKLTVDNVAAVPIQIVATRNRSKKAKEKAYPVYAEAEGGYNIMPDEDSIESARYIDDLSKNLESHDPILREVMTKQRQEEQEQEQIEKPETEKKLTIEQIFQKEGQKLQDDKFDPTKYGLQDPENSFKR